MGSMGRWRAPGVRMAAADAFFLYAGSPAAPQQVGGLVLLGAGTGGPDQEAVVDAVRARLVQLPRFRQRLWWPSPWRRPRWVPAGNLDWAWHVPVRRLPAPGGRAALHRLVAELHVTPLPPDRPLWRLVLVPDVEPGLAAAVLVAHHAVADGLGLVLQALRLLEPADDPPAGRPPTADPPAGRVTGGRLPIAVGIPVGLAQLATDGRARLRLPTGRDRRRRFGTLSVPLADVRAVALRHRARVGDVLLSAVAGGLARVRPDLVDRPDRQLRAIMPLMARRPTSPAEGNLTAGVMVDLPLGLMPEPDRLERVARRGRRLRTGTRAAASRFVIRAVGNLPPPVPAWFARTVYGARYFQAIVSNMPGPDRPYRLAGAPLLAAWPIVPLADGAPLAVGALGWAGQLRIGVTADPALLEDPDGFGDAVRAVLEELAGTLSPGRRAG